MYVFQPFNSRCFTLFWFIGVGLICSSWIGFAFFWPYIIPVLISFATVPYSRFVESDMWRMTLWWPFMEYVREDNSVGFNNRNV